MCVFNEASKGALWGLVLDMRLFFHSGLVFCDGDGFLELFSSFVLLAFKKPSDPSLPGGGVVSS